jgi:hypothetical protein
VCGRGCGGRDDEAGWLAGCHGGDGRAPSVRTRTLRELSLGRVSVGRVVSAELTRWCITRKWCAGAQVAAGPPSGRSAVSCSRGAVSGLLFSWVWEHAAAAGRLGRPRRRGWVETAGPRLGLVASHLSSSFVRRRPPARPRAALTHPEVRRPQWKKSGGRLIGVLRRVNRLMRLE